MLVKKNLSVCIYENMHTKAWEATSQAMNGGYFSGMWLEQEQNDKLTNFLYRHFCTV